MLKFRKCIALFCSMVLLLGITTFYNDNLTEVDAAGALLDTCDSATGWSGSNPVSLDTTDKKAGTGSLTRTGNGTDWFKKSFSTPINTGVTESNGYLHLWLYISDKSKMSNGQIEISSSGGPDNNEYNWSLSGNTLQSNGWNELVLKISSAGKMGSPNLNAINFIRIYCPLSASVTCKVDQIYFTDGNPVTLDNCDSTSGWSGSSAISLDTFEKKEGSASLTRTSNGTDWFKKTFSTPVNAGVTESEGYLCMWLYVSDKTKLSSGQIEITSSGGADVNEYNWSLSGSTIPNNGWNLLSLKLSNAGKMGTPDLSAINFIRIYCPLSASITCKLDKVFFSKVPVTAGDVVGKVYVGYQGWFACYGDGSPVERWVHWSGGAYRSDTPKPGPGYVTFELYPDVREYTTLFQTNLGNLGNGQPAKLFSSYTTQTVNKHFEWMQTYGIDGAAIQRFMSTDSVFMQHRNSVATKAKDAAETYGRKFYIMYDISGMNASTFVSTIQQDWTNTITGSLNLTSSSAYAKEEGKPVVCIWGMGFTDRPGDASQCLTLINWFKAQGCYVIGGVPTNWRTCTGDSKPGFENTYLAFDMISPWSVGRFGNPNGADNFKNNYLSPDFAYCQQNGIEYQPVMFPGFAWSNWNGGPRNEIPRLHGDFMWRQAYNIKSLGISNGYVAMFDEYDEGTAIAKAAENSSMIPNNQYFLTLDADGVACSADFYLRLTNDITKMIKGEISLATNHPTSHT